MTAEDHIVHLENTVATSGNADGVNDICRAADGSLVRVRVTRGTDGGHQSFQWQRISDPSSVTQWQSWTTFGGGAGNCFQEGGCAVSNNSGTLRAFAQQGSGGSLWVWTSTNNGVSWSTSPATVYTPAPIANMLGIGSAGNNDVFFILQGSNNCYLNACFYSTSWSALRTSTTPPIAYANGISVVWTGSFYAAAYSDGLSLWLNTYYPGSNTWNSQPIITGDTQAVARYYPSLVLIDGIYQLVCCEVDNGLLTGSSYNYPRVRQSADLQHWSGGFIYQEMSAVFGITYIKNTFPGASRAQYVLASMGEVMYGNDYQTSDISKYLDLSAYMLDYAREEQLDQPARITVTLDNSGNALTSYVSAVGGTSYKPLGMNATLVLHEGYRTGVPPVNDETIITATYKIRSITFIRSLLTNQLQIVAEDNSCLLDVRNRFQVTYVNCTLTWMINEICARAGIFTITLPGTGQMSTTIATFVLRANQTYRVALNELCRLGWLEYFMDQNGTIVFRELSNSDPGIWTYAPEIESLSIGSVDMQANHVIVIGKPPVGYSTGAITSGEAYDVTNVHQIAMERLLINTDPKLTSAALCSSKASFILQQEQRMMVAHRVMVPHNPALQLLDVVTLNDQSAPRGSGLSKTARIHQMHVVYNAEKAIYDLELQLEGM
jgi:hypothetical protein